MNYIKLLIAVLAGLLSCGVAFAKPPVTINSGVVIHVTDGDTLWVRMRASTDMPVKLRLRNIDAPEICQAGGTQARDALKARLLHRSITFESRARDAYQRTIADVWLDGQDIGAWLVGQGHAWSYGFRNVSGRYGEQQREAMALRRGLFAAGDAMEPRLFRKMHGPCDHPWSADSTRPSAEK
jgi:micrococcal nuclease